MIWQCYAFTGKPKKQTFIYIKTNQPAKTLVLVATRNDMTDVEIVLINWKVNVRMYDKVSLPDYVWQLKPTQRELSFVISSVYWRYMFAGL